MAMNSLGTLEHMVALLKLGVLVNVSEKEKVCRSLVLGYYSPPFEVANDSCTDRFPKMCVFLRNSFSSISSEL